MEATRRRLPQHHLNASPADLIVSSKMNLAVTRLAELSTGDIIRIETISVAATAAVSRQAAQGLAPKILAERRTHHPKEEGNRLLVESLTEEIGTNRNLVTTAVISMTSRVIMRMMTIIPRTVTRDIMIVRDRPATMIPMSVAMNTMPQLVRVVRSLPITTINMVVIFAGMSPDIRIMIVRPVVRMPKHLEDTMKKREIGMTTTVIVATRPLALPGSNEAREVPHTIGTTSILTAILPSQAPESKCSQRLGSMPLSRKSPRTCIPLNMLSLLCPPSLPSLPSLPKKIIITT